MAGRALAVALALVSGVTRAEAQAPGSIPTPESVLGHAVGADFRLATYETSIEYFQALDAATDRLELREVGRSSFGRPAYLALISSAENLANLDRHREIAQRLAHPRGLTDEEARQLAAEGRALVWIDGGLHASEVAHAQHTIQLAYDLVTGDADPETAAILDNVILLLWPSINPDGLTMIADWYHSNVGTPYEVAPAPFLYQKYIGHDNNRDGYMINQIESRYTTRVAREWEPHILYNHHQSSPFPTRIWIPPFAEPISPHVHPLMWRMVNLIGMAMSQALEERGQRGATHMGTGFDNWYPGFMDHAHNFHNVVSFLTETALYRYATPGFYTIGDFPPSDRDLRPESLYSSPWEGGWWRLRDAVDYMLTASISVLDVAAKYRTDLLYNRYQAGRDIIAEYEEGPPYAYFVPQAQRDPVAAVELLRRLAFNGIEIDQLREAVNHQGLDHPAGTWVIRMNQEFAHFVRQLFVIQDYPDLREYPEGPPDQPYDVSGWTLPLQMGVRVIEATAPLGAEVREALAPLSGEGLAWDAEVEDASPFDSPLGVGFDSHPVAAAIVPPAGRITGGGGALVVDPAQNNAFKAINRAWAAGARVSYLAGAPGADGTPGSGGRYAISGLPGEAALVRDLALQATRAAAGANLRRPRIGLYRPWNASMDEGWTRWLLERYGFDFTSLYNADVLAGDLSGRYDVIIVADMSGGQILNGFAKGSVPPRYEGGIGAEGVRELDAFVREGGTLVTLNRSSLFAIEELHLPVRNVVDGLDRAEYFQSGSILEMVVDPSHPVMSGMPERAAVIVERSPVFTTEEGFEGRVMAKYEAEGSPLLSGYLLGAEHLAGYAAAVDVAHGAGRVVLLGMRPQWRGQPFGNFRLLFNAALYGRDLAAAAPESPDFWTAPDATEDETEDETAGGTGDGGEDDRRRAGGRGGGGSTGGAGP
ncbi:M14 family metallopeptidase [Candidatus Palauibacter sp.]|uniref:M14 family metallopeptidase n=1 Tax=Candidatus Palauibacter sp. TaxID=3101350 RepID=UPI003B020745